MSAHPAGSAGSAAPAAGVAPTAPAPDDAVWQRLRALAARAMERAYAPCSRFRVGAAALVEDGRLVPGCHVENASHGVTLCAECGLVSELVRTGGGRLVALVCVDGRGEPCAPCGRCRQLLAEHAAPGMVLAVPGGITTIDEVLPGRRPRAPEPFDAVEIIAAKRDGARLSGPQIDWVIDAYTRGVVADEQMSALAMAIYLGGMDRAETARWTGAMIRSGERMDFSRLGRPTADKHSTGGVGDKTTLPPLLRRNRTDLDAELDRSRRRGPRGW